MQLTWAFTGWAAVVSLIALLLYAWYLARAARRTRSQPSYIRIFYVPNQLAVGLSIIAALWMAIVAFREAAPAWPQWLAAATLLTTGLYYAVSINVSWRGMVLGQFVPLTVLTLALLVTGVTGLLNLSQSRPLSADTAPWTAELKSAQSDLAASRTHLESALQSLQTAQTQAEDLARLVQDLEQQQITLEQWLKLKGNEETLRSYFDAQFRRNSREQMIWGLIGLFGGVLFGFVSPHLARKFRKAASPPASPPTEPPAASPKEK